MKKKIKRKIPIERCRCNECGKRFFNPINIGNQLSRHIPGLPLGCPHCRSTNFKYID